MLCAKKLHWSPIDDRMPSGSCHTVSDRVGSVASSKPGWEWTPNPTEVTREHRPRLLLVSCHEETQDKVDSFLPVVWCLSAHHVWRRSDEEAGKERCYEAGC